MKRLETLRSLINILFVACMFCVIFGLPMILLLAIMPGVVPLTINEEPITNITMEIIILMSVVYAGYCFFTYGIFQFRKLLKLFSQKKIFDDMVIVLFDQIGKTFLVTSMLWAAAPFFYKLLAEKKFMIGLGFDGFGSAIFSAALGLFFMVLSEVFEMAKNLKEEHDLTV